jgi:hypothetical protein
VKEGQAQPHRRRRGGILYMPTTRRFRRGLTDGWSPRREMEPEAWTRWVRLFLIAVALQQLLKRHLIARRQ